MKSIHKELPETTELFSQIMDAATIARRLKVSSRLVHIWAEKGVIPTVLRQGRIVRFDWGEVAKALKLN